MQLFVILYFLAALLGVWLGKGWLAKRPSLTWTIVGLGAVGVIVMVLAGRQHMPPLLTIFPVPLLACLAAGLAVSRTDWSGFWRILTLAVVSIVVTFVCYINIPWEL